MSTSSSASRSSSEACRPAAVLGGERGRPRRVEVGHRHQPGSPGASPRRARTAGDVAGADDAEPEGSPDRTRLRHQGGASAIRAGWSMPYRRPMNVDQIALQLYTVRAPRRAPYVPGTLRRCRTGYRFVEGRRDAGDAGREPCDPPRRRRARAVAVHAGDRCCEAPPKPWPTDSRHSERIGSSFLDARRGPRHRRDVRRLPMS